jgi:hypothetical protein
LRQPYRERQEDQLGSRELVVDMIVLSNTSNRLRRIMKRVFSQDRVFCFARNDTDTRLAIFLAQEVTRGGKIRNSSFLRAPACVLRPACSGRKGAKLHFAAASRASATSFFVRASNSASVGEDPAF